MAAAFMQPHATSAGLSPDDAVDPFAVGCMLEDGKDISSHTPTLVNPAQISPDTIVITLTEAAFNQARQWRESAGFELEYWDLPDVPNHDGPRAMIADGYKAIREAIKAHIRNRFRP
jgi:protein-tyrosine-phosphatase